MSVLSSVIFLFYNLIYVAKPSEFPPKIRIFGPPNFEKRFIKNPGLSVWYKRFYLTKENFLKSNYISPFNGIPTFYCFDAFEGKMSINKLP